jgi:hypothetical protein
MDQLRELKSLSSLASRDADAFAAIVSAAGGGTSTAHSGRYFAPTVSSTPVAKRRVTPVIRTGPHRHSAAVDSTAPLYTHALTAHTYTAIALLLAMLTTWLSPHVAYLASLRRVRHRLLT